MDHKRAQRRMLICAALFSFGTLGGALTVFELSSASAERITAEIGSFVSFHPTVLILLFAVLFACLLLLSGLSIFGSVFTCLLLAVIGSSCGFLVSLALRSAFYPVVSAAFLAVFGLCYIQLGAGMLRRSALLLKQRTCSGLAKPDASFDRPSVWGSFILLILTAGSLACFILNL